MPNRTGNSRPRTNGKKASASRGTRSASTNKKKKQMKNENKLMLFLVLVIAGIAIAIIIFNQMNTSGNPTGGKITPGALITPSAGPGKEPQSTPSQGITNTVIPSLTDSVKPSVTITTAPSVSTTPTKVPTESTPTEVPIAEVSADKAQTIVEAVIDKAVYKARLLKDLLVIEEQSYYAFSISKGTEEVLPYLLVNKLSGRIFCYDSIEGISDFVKFPLDEVSIPSVTPGTGAAGSAENISVEQAYLELCRYSKEVLGLAKNVAEYDAEYDSELTLVKGNNCYRITLTEVSGGKIRNRGEFYVSVDGKYCFIMNYELNEFIQIQK